MIKTFKIHTLGCKVNQYDSNNLSLFLLSRGIKKVDKKADLVFVNTCSVTKSAMVKNQKAINRYKRENPKAVMVAVGCWPKVYDLKQIKNIDYIVLGVDPKGIVDYLNDKIIFDFNKGSNEYFSSIERSRYFLKIQDGCEQFCSYCVIPYSRGKLKSRSENEVIREAQKAVSHGYEEIVLSGIHIGLYGREKDSKVSLSLAGLVGKLKNIKGLKKIRISSIEINEVNNELLKVIDSEKVCKHLHISLQSGDDKILESMNRPYSSKYFKKRVEEIRKEIPGISISTDIIVGFPGETDENFQTTYDFAEKLKFSKIHVFSFSAHEKTPAYSMEGQNDKKTIAKRSVVLRELSGRLEKEFADSKKGEIVEGIVEHIDGDKVKIRSEYYFEFWKDINDFDSKVEVAKLVKLKY